MADIKLHTNVNQININGGTDNVNGVVLKDSSGSSHKVWGHPYTFKWDWDPYLNTSSSAFSSALTIPSKDFLYKPDNLISFSCSSSSYNSYAYMPHDSYNLPRATNTSIYYGDNISYTSTTWDTSKIDPCISYVMLYPSSLTNLKSNTSVNVLPVIKPGVSFLKCEIPSSLSKYFSKAYFTYRQYSSSLQTSREVTPSSNNPMYIASNATGNSQTVGCFWQFMSDNQGEWVGCASDGNYYPLWSKLYTQISFPTSNNTCWDIPNPSKIKYNVKYIPRKGAVSYVYFDSTFHPTYSWNEYKLYVTANFSVAINWKNVPMMSNYAYYKVVIIGYQLQGSSNDYLYNPSKTHCLFRIESSTIYHSSIAGRTFKQTVDISSPQLWPTTQYENVYIVWRAGIIGSTTNSLDTSAWEWLDIYSDILYDTF